MAYPKDGFVKENVKESFSTSIRTKILERRKLVNLSKKLDEYNKMLEFHLGRLTNPKVKWVPIDQYRAKRINDLILEINGQIEELGDYTVDNKRDFELIRSLQAKALKVIEVRNNVSKAYQQRFLRAKIKEANMPNGINTFKNTLPVKISVNQERPKGISLTKYTEMVADIVAKIQDSNRKLKYIHPEIKNAPYAHPEFKPKALIGAETEPNVYVHPEFKDSGTIDTSDIPWSWERDYIVDNINDATVKGIAALGYVQDDIERNIKNIFRKQPVEKNINQYKNSPFLRKPSENRNFLSYMDKKAHGKNPSIDYADFSDLKPIQAYKNTVPNNYVEAVAKGIGESAIKRFSPGNMVMDSIDDKLSLGASQVLKIDKKALDAAKIIPDVYHDWEKSKEE